jgi:hypothetical protein
MTARRLGTACAAALWICACGSVGPDWGFEESVDWDVGAGSDHTVTYDPCGDMDGGTCDPLTNSGCDAGAGYACSYYQGPLGPFACLSDSTEPAGAACDADDGPWCGAALACAPADGGPGACVPLCCGDDECDDGEACAPFGYDDVAPPFGRCVEPADADTGD